MLQFILYSYGFENEYITLQDHLNADGLSRLPMNVIEITPINYGLDYVDNECLKQN